MINLRFFNLTLSYLGMIFFILFMMENVGSIEEPGGYLYLAFFLLCFSFVFFLGGMFNTIRFVNVSFIYLAVFLIYVVFSYVLRTFDLDGLRQLMLGTTGGVVFGLFSGASCSLLIAKIHNICKRDSFCKKFSFLYLFILLITLLVNSQEAYSSYILDVRKDLFLIATQSGNYQRPASFMFMSFMISISLVVMHLSLEIRRGKIVFFIYSLLIFYLSFQFSALSQLIGSNSGVITILGFLFVYIVFLFVFYFSNNDVNEIKGVSVFNIVFSSLGFKYLIYIPLIVLFMSLLFYFYVSSQSVDLDRFRIFGYGGSVTSVESRIALLDNFMTHFSYNPIFGNMIVEKVTTGEGTYIHSLFSLLTHLGVFGFVLFFLMLFKILSEIKYKTSKSELSIYGDRYYALYRIAGLSAVVTFCVFSSFFTWLPLWFAFGLIGLSFRMKDV